MAHSLTVPVEIDLLPVLAQIAEAQAAADHLLATLEALVPLYQQVQAQIDVPALTAQSGRAMLPDAVAAELAFHARLSRAG